MADATVAEEEYLQTILKHYDAMNASSKMVSPMHSVFAAVLCGRVDNIEQAKKYAQEALTIVSKPAEKGMRPMSKQPFEKFAQATEAGKVPTVLEFSTWMRAASQAAVPAERVK